MCCDGRDIVAVMSVATFRWASDTHCASLSLLRLLSLFFVVSTVLSGMAQAQDDGDTAPPVKIPVRGDSTTLDFDDRVYGRRNYTADPVFRAGDVASVGFPEVDLSLELPSLSSWTDVELPLFEERELDEALLNLGPLTLDVDRFAAAMVFSDNVEQANHGRDAQAIGVIALQDIRAAWELTETTQLSLEGNLILAPFEGKMGLNGFGMPRDSLVFALGADGSLSPSADVSDFHGEISNTFKSGEWSITTRDSFGVRNFEVRQGFDTYLEEELTMLELGVNPGLEGSYFDPFGDSDLDVPLSLGEGGQAGASGAEIERGRSWDRASRRSHYSTDGDDDDASLELTNDLSLTISREAVASIRPVVRIFRKDSSYWYADQEQEAAEKGGRASEHEGATLGLAMDRPNMRFPPYLSYTISRDGDADGWDRTWRLGILGPSRITDYIFFSGNVGLYTQDEADSQEEEAETIYAFHLAHQPRPMTLHSLDFFRFVEEPENELRRQASYRLRQGLGPRLTASFVATRSELESGEPGSQDEEEWGVGGSLRYAQGAFSVAWRSFYEQEWNEGTGKEPADWGHQISTRYRFAGIASAHYEYTWEDEGDEQEHALNLNSVLYRHKGMFTIAYRLQWRDSEEEDETYYENLLVLTATRDTDGWSLSDLFGGGRKETP